MIRSSLSRSIAPVAARLGGRAAAGRVSSAARSASTATAPARADSASGMRGAASPAASAFAAALPAARSSLLPSAAVVLGAALLVADGLLTDAPLLAEPLRVEFMLAEADRMYDSNADPDALAAFLEDCVHSRPGSAELLWRFARAVYDLHKDSALGKKEKLALLQKSMALLEEAMEVDDENWAVHKWYGIVLSGVGEFTSTKKKIGDSFRVREAFERAAELNPEDATCVHLLGRWCYGVSSISWAERKVASVIFATPPKSSFKEALKWFLAAEEVEPGFWKDNRLYIARCYLRLKDKTNARKWLQATLELPDVKREDPDTHKEAQRLLKKL